jgi:hypothetical protein
MRANTEQFQILLLRLRFEICDLGFRFDTCQAQLIAEADASQGGN